MLARTKVGIVGTPRATQPQYPHAELKSVHKWTAPPSFRPILLFSRSTLALVQGLRAPVVQGHEGFSRRLSVALDGTVIVAISDLHLGSLLGATWLAARVEQVQAQKPDLVVLIGEVFEGHSVPAAELLTVLKSMSAPLGKWGVVGNREMHSGRDANGAIFEGAGVHLLRNGWMELRPGLILAGLESLSFGPGAGVDGPALAAVLAGRPPGAAVLVAHAPPPQEVVWPVRVWTCCSRATRTADSCGRSAISSDSSFRSSKGAIRSGAPR